MISVAEVAHLGFSYRDHGNTAPLPNNFQLPLGCRVEFDLGGGRQVLRYLEDLVAG
jgi:hypothetical protein